MSMCLAREVLIGSLILDKRSQINHSVGNQAWCSPQEFWTYSPAFILLLNALHNTVPTLHITYQVWACPESPLMPANCLSNPDACPFNTYGFKAAGLSYCQFEVPGEWCIGYYSLDAVSLMSSEHWEISNLENAKELTLSCFPVPTTQAEGQDNFQVGDSFEIPFYALGSNGR